MHLKNAAIAKKLDVTEKAFNNVWIGPVNEFTVRHPTGEILMLSGYLAAYAQRNIVSVN